ncbi:MAG: hypothetical protein QMD85_04220 [Candidatus Aenigmarchaeota archaeon]|nr:hypothetical protein [Candidatus Aenigmarchaeota archaeon]MDI6722769.1 hypothetical protein [Candidatus Aenigmarchaeota archaeon]
MHNININSVSILMVLDFLASLGPANLIMIATALVVFIYGFKNLISLIKGAFFVSIASGIFPVVANKVFGMEVPLTIETLLEFVLLGLGLYFIFMFGKTIHKILSVIDKSASFFSKKPSYKPAKTHGNDPYHTEDDRNRRREKNK